MFRTAHAALALLVLPLLLPLGCAATDGADDPAETSEQASTASDLTLARSVLGLIGGPNGRCVGCHTATPTNVRAWGKAMQAVDAACFAPASLTARQRVDCLRTTPSSSSSAFSPHKLGLYAAGATLPAMEALFRDASTPSTFRSRFAAFQRQAAMPRGRTPMSAADFAKVKGWVLRGMPQLDQAVSGGPGPVAACTGSTTPELSAHVTAMRTEGWGARLADQSTPMFGCGAGAGALGCLATLPDLTAQIGASGVTQKVRKLREQPLASHYWVRSSADGRWVGFGFNTSAQVVDLTKPEAPPIAIGANYDPFFLPSNDGFAFAGAHSDDNIRLCKQSLLADVAGRAAPSITLLEPKCTQIGRAVYQSIGSALDGARYFVTVGQHVNDDGGHDVVAPLPAEFSAGAVTTFIPMVNDGAAYRAGAPVDVVIPGEGDVMLSPSTRLLVSRFGGAGAPSGYRVRAVEARSAASGAVSVTTPLRGEVCLEGGKATFSFDERFLATHQYVDRTRPGQGSLAQGSSNIVVADLKAGTSVRLTSMAAGQFALYPHFRADGWLYFLVRDMNAKIEYVAATDVAARMAAQ